MGCETPTGKVGASQTLRLSSGSICTPTDVGLDKILSVVVRRIAPDTGTRSQLDEDSTPRRIEAIDALERLGPVANVAVRALLRRLYIRRYRRLPAVLGHSRNSRIPKRSGTWKLLAPV